MRFFHFRCVCGKLKKRLSSLADINHNLLFSELSSSPAKDDHPPFIPIINITPFVCSI